MAKSADDVFKAAAAYAARLTVQTMKDDAQPMKMRLDLAAVVLDRSIGKPAAAAQPPQEMPQVVIVDDIPDP